MPIGALFRYDEETLSTSGSGYFNTVSVAGRKGATAPGSHPFIIRGMALQHLTTFAYTSAICAGFYLNTQPGLGVTGNYTALKIFTLTTLQGGTIGQVFYGSPSAPTACRPGTEVVLHIGASTSTVSESHAVRATLFVTQGEENPTINTSMTAG